MNNKPNIEKLNEQLSKRLVEKLKMKLPGTKSHLKMSPKRNGVPFRPVKTPSSARSSAVLLLINKSPFDNEYKILLTLRSSSLRSHSGQISFPGGKMDDGETPIQTAIRETEEETGIIVKQNDIIGSISNLFVPHSNSAIHPIVALTNSEYNLNINPDEVEEAWFEPISSLTNTNNIKEEIWELSGFDTEVPFWDIHHSTPLWGATAVILSEFMDIIEM